MLGTLKAAIGALTKFPKSDGADLQLTGFRSLKVSAVEPIFLELSRAGRLFVAGTTAVAGGRAPVQDVPTTTANWLLFNPASSLRSLVVLKAGYFLASGTADKGAAVIGGVTPSKPTDANAPTATAANHGVASPRGVTNAGNGPFLDVNKTVPSMASSFVLLGGNEQAANATPGSSQMFNVDGLLIVPPGFGAAFDVLSGAGTTAKYGISLVCAALELDLD